MDILTIRRKAFAYVTSGSRLLVFTHPNHPVAGMQVPAGTVEQGESTADAALREAREETGLTSLRIHRWIGRDLFDAHPYGRDEFHDRWFYHLVCDGTPPDTWIHGESPSSNGIRDVIPFEFFWVDISGDMPRLIADHDRFIMELKAILRLA